MVLSYGQVGLMAVVPTAMAALDSHGDSRDVSENYVRLLMKLSIEDENKVFVESVLLGGKNLIDITYINRASCHLSLFLLVSCLFRQASLLVAVPSALAAVRSHVDTLEVVNIGMLFVYLMSLRAANLPMLRSCGAEELARTAIAMHPTVEWAEQLLKQLE